jgi:predicted nucleic acid-binding protein
MQDAVVDACCLINFVATGRLPDVVAASELRWHVPRQVFAEVMYVPSDGDQPQSAGALLREYARAGALLECALAESEQALFVGYAAELDDGEAAALVIAVSRGWKLATDDRKAIRLATDAGVPVVTTPELVRRWADAADPPAAEIRDLLYRIQRLARFTPRRDDDHYEWWRRSLGS